MLILWQLNLNPKQSVHRNPSNRKFPSGSSNSSKRIQNRKTLVTEDKTKENEKEKILQTSGLSEMYEEVEVLSVSSDVMDDGRAYERPRPNRPGPVKILLGL